MLNMKLFKLTLLLVMSIMFFGCLPRGTLSGGTIPTRLASTEIISNPDFPSEFPSGDLGLYQYLSEFIQNSDTLSSITDTMKFSAQFVVEIDGQLTGLKLYEGNFEGEITRQVRGMLYGMPNWTSAVHDEEKVRSKTMVMFSIPLNGRVMKY